MKVAQLEKSGIEAIKNLRDYKLKNGLPFMINAKTLPSNQCYLEYPNGSVDLVVLSKKDNDFKVITKYSALEGSLIKKQFKLV
ncbi:MAG: hypothetical protein ABIP10_13390 [Ferruginibacter sp.]